MKGRPWQASCFLITEPAQEIAVVRELLFQYFYGDPTVLYPVIGAVYIGHTAHTYQVFGEFWANHQGAGADPPPPEHNYPRAGCA